jgi:hypothetical protein
VFSNTPLPFSSALFAPAAGAGVLSLESGASIEAKDLGANILLVDVAGGGKGSQIVVARSVSISALEISESASGIFSVSSAGASIRDLAGAKVCAGPLPKGPDYSIAMPSQNTFTISSISTPVEGCFDVSFENGQRAHVCMPRTAWPFEIGDAVGVQGIDVVGLANGVETRVRVETVSSSSTVDLSCAWADMCGTIAFGVDVGLPDGTTGHAGDDRTIGNARFLVGRAVSLTVVNTRCKDVLPNQAVGIHTSLVRIETQSVMGMDAGSDANDAGHRTVGAKDDSRSRSPSVRVRIEEDDRRG